MSVESSRILRSAKIKTPSADLRAVASARSLRYGKVDYCPDDVDALIVSRMMLTGAGAMLLYLEIFEFWFSRRRRF
jgi:hypothetical protein